LSCILRGRLLLVTVFALLGALSKILGSLLYGSRALFVDALTSIANLAALFLALYYLSKSMKPPDADHPFGHMRLRYGGIAAILSIYMFIAGFSAATLYYSSHGYRVEEGSAYAAIIGAAFYAAAIAFSRNLDESIRVYAGFTASELVEASIVVPSTWLGYAKGYLFDLVGAVIILLYLFYEAIETHQHLVRAIADTSPPPRVYEEVKREARLRGLVPVAIRLRMIDEKHCSGDMTVRPQKGITPDIADVLADEVVEELRQRGCDIVIHIDYSKPWIRDREENRMHSKSSTQK